MAELEIGEMQNPYYNRGIIPIDSDMFFGRTAEMRSIESCLFSDNPQSVSIVGERRIGKSSLAFRVYHKLKAADNMLTIFLDFSEIDKEYKTVEEFYEILSSYFKKSLNENPALKARFNQQVLSFNDWSSFKEFIKTKPKDVKAILFFDEFELLVKKKFSDDTFFSNLRSLAYNPDNKLAYVTISQQSLDKITNESILKSQFWNIFEQEIIALVDDDNITALRTKGFVNYGFELSRQDDADINYYAGNFLFFNQIVCAAFFESKRNGGQINKPKLETELLKHFKNIWAHRTKEEQKFLKHIQNIPTSDMSDLYNELESRGIIVKYGDGYEPFCQFFSECIANFKIANKWTWVGIMKRAIPILALVYGVVKYAKKILLLFIDN